jgi:hypothetical protein
MEQANKISDEICYFLYSNLAPLGKTCLMKKISIILLTPSIPVLRAQFTNHAIPKYLHLLGILAFKMFN